MGGGVGGGGRSVALTAEDVKDMEHQLNMVNEESLKTGPKNEDT